MTTRKRNRQSPPRFRSSRGTTLIEVQIAAMLAALAFLTIVDYARVQNELIGSIESDRWADGSLDPTNERLVLVATDVGPDAAAPLCEIRITEVDYIGLYPTVEVVVRQRGV